MLPLRTHEDAIEYLEYNVWGAHVGDQTPIYVEVGKYDELVDFLDQKEYSYINLSYEARDKINYNQSQRLPI